MYVGTFQSCFFAIQFKVQVWTLTEWCCLTGWHIYPVLPWTAKSFFRDKAFPAACFIHILLISQYSPAGYRYQFFYTRHCACVMIHTLKSEIKLKSFDCCPVFSAHHHITLLQKHSHADLIKIQLCVKYGSSIFLNSLTGVLSTKLHVAIVVEVELEFPTLKTSPKRLSDFLSVGPAHILVPKDENTKSVIINASKNRFKQFDKCCKCGITLFQFLICKINFLLKIFST